MSLDGVSTQVLEALVNTFPPAVMLAAGVWALLTFLPRLNASTRYAAWWTVLAAVLCLPLTQWRTLSAQPEIDTTIIAADLTASTPPPSVEASAPVVSPTPSTPFPIHLETGRYGLILAALWAAGTFANLLRLFLSYLDLRGILKRARPLDPELLTRWTARFDIRRPVNLLTSEEIGSPLAAGYLHPSVLVPESLLSRLEGDLADHVLIHELAHLGRRDDWAKLAGRLLEAAVWFHPVARWILKRLEFERELACDDWVAAVSSRRAYAASLTRLAELRVGKSQHALAASMVGQGSQVGRRVRSLLDPRRNAGLGISRGGFVLAVTVIAGLLVCGAQAPGFVVFASADAAVDSWDGPEPPAPPRPPESPAAQAPPAPRAPSAAPSRVSLPAPPSPPSPPVPPSPPGFLAALAQFGYQDLDVDQIVELKAQGVTASFMKEMNEAGFGKLTTRQLVDIRIHGVTPAYLAGLRNAGIPGFTLEQAKELKIHGVKAADIAAIHALGYGPYTVREVNEFAIHGVHEDYFRALKENGVSEFSARDIIEAKIHGVSAQNLRDAKQYGGPGNIRRVIKLKQAGVL
jgi:beta-lactamase regulating signal transducer with metallopeptidase domain